MLVVVVVVTVVAEVLVVSVSFVVEVVVTVVVVSVSFVVEVVVTVVVVSVSFVVEVVVTVVVVSVSFVVEVVVTVAVVSLSLVEVVVISGVVTGVLTVIEPLSMSTFSALPFVSTALMSLTLIGYVPSAAGAMKFRYRITASSSAFWLLPFASSQITVFSLRLTVGLPLLLIQLIANQCLSPWKLCCSTPLSSQ